MESVEDIPASSILEVELGVGELRRLPERHRRRAQGNQRGRLRGDVAIRLYVAGDAACERDFAATPEQLTQMAAQVDEAVRAGAFGYSISRSLFHRVPDGRNVPGTWSDPSEFFATAALLDAIGRGVLESAPRYNFENEPGDRVDEELAWMAEISRALGRPFSFNLQQIASLGDHYRRVIDLAAEANQAGSQRPQITPPQRGRAVQPGRQHLIDDLPAFAEIADRDLAGRLAAIRPGATRPHHRAGGGQGRRSVHPHVPDARRSAGALRLLEGRFDRRHRRPLRDHPGGGLTSMRSIDPMAGPSSTGR
ncbi:MAG: hypothetical protein IPF88_14145 [Candidatus Microthrix sp.]|nr:hypothetical protein [Candidatus Microthrix sp.]MBK6439689.1 hypothetical protein [Candidatus Microthrix sp.]